MRHVFPDQRRRGVRRGVENTVATFRGSTGSLPSGHSGGAIKPSISPWVTFENKLRITCDVPQVTGIFDAAFRPHRIDEYADEANNRGVSPRGEAASRTPSRLIRTRLPISADTRADTAQDCGAIEIGPHRWTLLNRP
jgi:hypothetical protein